MKARRDPVPTGGTQRPSEVDAPAGPGTEADTEPHEYYSVPCLAQELASDGSVIEGTSGVTPIGPSAPPDKGGR